MKTRLVFGSVVVAVLGLSGCAERPDPNDATTLANSCVHGSSEDCTKFEALYGADPRSPTMCAKVGEKLPSCVGNSRPLDDTPGKAF